MEKCIPVIRVEMFPRSLDQKRKLAKALTETMMEVCELAPQAIQIMFDDLQPSDYAIGGEIFSDRAAAAASPNSK